jgi:anti-sigma-K factor RskA
MKLTAPRRAHVASAYAVGTLPPRARAWVERRMRHDVALCFAITGWQDHLARWLELLAPVEPRPEVWEGLARAVAAAARPQGRAAAAAPAAVEPPTIIAAPRPAAAPLAARWVGSLSFWRAGAGVALAAALALAIGLGLALQPLPPSTHSAVFADGQGRPVWILEATLPEGRLGLRALAGAPPPPERAYELWMLPAGGAPVSLGLLPASGSAERHIPAALGARLLTAAGLAVSVEPAGGSPTGQPTGPVVYQAALVRT